MLETKSVGRGMAFLVRDVVPTDADAIVGILNPIIEARVHTVFDAPFSPDRERDYIVRFPSRGVWKVALRESDDLVVTEIDGGEEVHGDRVWGLGSRVWSE